MVKKPFNENRQIYLDASPITKVRPDAPPFFILHGSDDSIIPVGEGREFVEALEEKSDEVVVYAEIPARPARIRLLRLAARRTSPRRRSAHFLYWVKAKRG